jgi:hypothetical protein
MSLLKVEILDLKGAIIFSKDLKSTTTILELKELL